MVKEINKKVPYPTSIYKPVNFFKDLDAAIDKTNITIQSNRAIPNNDLLVDTASQILSLAENVFTKIKNTNAQYRRPIFSHNDIETILKIFKVLLLLIKTHTPEFLVESVGEGKKKRYIRTTRKRRNATNRKKKRNTTNRKKKRNATNRKKIYKHKYKN
jgi:hypothetical protein